MSLGRVKALERRLAKLKQHDTGAALKRAWSRYAGDPGRYARDHLGRGLTPQQETILRKLSEPPYRVLVRSANTQGKTFVAAVKCSHFYDTVAPSITLATAPTYVQVQDLLFKELRSLRPSLAEFLPKDTRLQRSVNHYVHGFTANKADAFQGRHGEHLGIVFDEATGVHRDFWGRAETMFESHGGHWWLACYNPHDSSSPAYQAEESGGWHLVVLNALEHPNVLAELEGLPPPIPAAIRLDTVLRRMAAECEPVHEAFVVPAVDFEFPADSGNWWRPLTPEFEAQVLGRWPVSPSAALWSPVRFDLCCGPVDINPDWAFAVGCDVARFGDDKTTIAARWGPVLVKLEVYSGVTTDWIARRLGDVCGELAVLVPGLMIDERRVLAESIPCYIDDTGGYGAGVVDQCGAYDFRGLNMSSAATDIRFPNLRSQLWCQLADAAHRGAVNFARLSFEDRVKLKQELTSARYSVNNRGMRVVEPKAHIKERLGRSPDRADAVILAYASLEG